MSFADRLRELREAKGLSREDLSQLCGLGRGTVRDYEQGRREPSLQSAFKLAEALGVGVEEFKNGVEEAAATPRKPAKPSPTPPADTADAEAARASQEEAAPKAERKPAAEKKPAKGPGRKRKNK